MIRILHISDLHASRDGEADRRMLVEGMLQDVESFSAEKPVDLAIFSGDLADKGTADEYALALGLLIEPLVDRLRIDHDRLIAIPGNHDVDREMIRANVERGLAQGLGNREEVEALLSDDRDVEDALERLSGWQAFVEDAALDGGDHDVVEVGALAIGRKLEIEGRSVGLALINSSWRCSGAEDRGRLLVGMPQAEAALRAVSDCDVRLAVVHHPLDWLASFEADQLQREFEAQGAVVLSGHEHSAKPGAQKSPRGESLYLRAGCLYSGSDYPNSYFLIDIDPDDRVVRVHIRRWAPDLREFSAATEVAKAGAFDFELPRGGGATDLGHPPFSTVMSSIAGLAQERRMLPEDMSETDSTPGSIEEVLIAPRFLSVPFKDAQAAATFSDGISGHEVDGVQEMLDAEVVLVSGDAQSGVSSSLLWLLSQGYRRDASKMPAYLPASQSGIGTRKEQATLAKASSLFGHRKDESPDPDLMLAVDDLDPVAPHKLERLLGFIAEHSRHRYLLGCESDRANEIAEALNEAGIQHSRIYLAPFGRTELRKLAKTIKRGDEADVEQIYGLIRTQSLPQTPFTMVALITVVTAEQLRADLNESDLLEAFVKLLLGSGELADMEQLGMDFRRRVVLLGELARKIYEVPSLSIPVADAEQLLLEYFRSCGLRLSAGQVLTSLVSRHVLIEHEGQIGFRHPALLHLFVGQWMLEDDDNKLAMLEDCGANAKPITHAAALKRNDRELLAKVGEHCASVIATVAEKLPLSKVDELLEDFEAVDTWAGDRFDDTLAIMPERRSRAELDAEIDRISETFDVREKPLESPAVQALSELEQATTLLSNVLRSSELVADVELKRDLLEKALEGWGLVIGAMLVEDTNDTSIRGLIEEVAYEHAEGEDEAEMATRVMLMLLVLVTAAMAQTRLSSPQLAATLDACLENPEFTASPTASSLAVWTEARLELPEWPARLEELLERLPSKSFLRNATIAIAVSIYRSTHDEAMARRLGESLSRHLSPEIKSGRASGMQREAARTKVSEALLRSRRSWQSGGGDVAALPAKTEASTLAQLESVSQAALDTKVPVESGQDPDET
ncbi:MAG TPA: metallophosphoesterase [Solirubrobacterales bacterium]